ncbi:MAG: hypothetical protein II931_01895 [Clostridia bacterium]|nr:hypothetical protein [Clostridia bacterium]
MNPLYEQLTNNDEHDYSEARRKLLEAMDAFGKLKPEKKEQLFCEIAKAKGLQEIVNYFRSTY